MASAGPARTAVIVSGRPLVAGALRALLADECGHDHCHAVHDERGLLALPPATGPSAWLIDLDEPGIGQAAVAAAVPASDARRLGFYDEFTARHADVAFALGLTVLLPLASSLDHLHHAVFGDRPTSSATEATGLTRGELGRLATLTPREIEVLRLLAGGLPVPAVARQLGITAHTVDTHKRRTFEKLDVQQQALAVSLAVQAGLVLLE